MRNPVGGGFNTQRMFHGVGTEDFVGAVGGFALASLVPPMVVREASDPGGKLLRLVAGLAVVVLGGMAANTISAKAAKAAIIGGLTGVGAQAIQAFTPMRIALPAGRLRATDIVSFPTGRQDETVNVIQP